jgi:hypothetical protein
MSETQVGRDSASRHFEFWFFPLRTPTIYLPVVLSLALYHCSVSQTRNALSLHSN